MPTLFLRRTPLGNAVFAGRAIRPREPILEFAGVPYAAEDLSDPYTIDHSLQIGSDTHLGPTGGIDDFVNHSCDPNCGVLVGVERVLLVAVRAIAEGDELAYDYSTTMYRNPWPMEECRCGASNCRGRIGDYSELTDERRRFYESLGIVPKYAIPRRATSRRVIERGING